MAGFTLPKLRWLVIGAVAAGVWAMNQEPPKREHWERRAALETNHDQARKPRLQAPQKVERPDPKPTRETTSAIPRPQAPVARTFFTTEKVRLRAGPGTDTQALTMLGAGVAVETGAVDGKWRQVSVEGRTGWVHGDYLSAHRAPTGAVPSPDPILGDPPRPPEPVVSTVAVAPTDMSLWNGLTPMRKPQISDCQCPYDLMLNGKQCGDRSAYAKGRGSECYR
jgi:hypothetical protein